MRNYRFIYLLMIFLSFSFVFKIEIQLRISRDAVKKGERIRSLVAAVIWKRADELMHRGAIDPYRQRFKAGSYVGNTDIIPMLKLVTIIMPEEPAPYQLLSRCLAYAQGTIDEGLKVLQKGILNNKKSKGVHELYASAAFLKIFFKNDAMTDADKYSALKYLKVAGRYYEKNSESVSSDPAFIPENYKILIARLYIELNRPSDALRTLEESGIKLDASDDLIFSYLSEYKISGAENKLNFSANFGGSSDSDQVLDSYEEPEKHVCTQDCNHDGAGDEKKVPTLKHFFSALKSGLLFIALLVSGYVKKETN